MRLTSKLTASLFALALTVGLSATANAADKGTIKGSVTGTDGKPAAAMTVRVTAPGQGGGRQKPADGAAKEAPKTLADRPAGGNRAPAVAEAKTDDKGEFSVEVPAGEYVVRAGSREAGMGMSDKVTVEAGKTVEVKITLKARPAPAAK